MKSFIILIAFFLVKIICFGQENILSLNIINSKGNIKLNKNSDSIYYQSNYNSIIIKIAPLQILGGDFITNSFSAGFSVEKAIKKQYSIFIGARYIFTDKRDVFDKNWIVINVAKVNGIGVDAETRRYFSKEKPEMTGAFLSGNLKLVYTTSNYQSYKVNRLSTATYLNIGWQEIFDSGVVFDIAIGIGAKYVISNSNTDPNSISISRHIMDGGKKPYHTGWAFFPFVNLNLNLGYAFRNN